MKDNGQIKKNKSNKVIIFDTTLRDGEQSPGFSMNIDEKLHFTNQLIKLGIDVIEAGFPIASRTGAMEGTGLTEFFLNNRESILPISSRLLLPPP